LSEETSPGFKAGFVALVGRPNAGKSTILNGALGEKLAAVTPKPQTTRERILGVLTTAGYQMAFVDTPGYHRPKRELNRYMVREAIRALSEVDAVALVVDATTEFGEEDKALLEEIAKAEKPAVLALNKIDRLKDKSQLLPMISAWSARHPFAAIVPISASRKDGVDRLLGELAAHLPEGPALYPADQYTDRPARFVVAELIREQVFLQTGQEIPYASAVTIERYEDPEELGEPAEGRPPRATVISATIHVERDSQKAIVIGKGGQMLKKIGTAARQAIEEAIGQKVFLELFVRVEPDWSHDPQAMRKLGYEESKE
jgi:GTPase